MKQGVEEVVLRGITYLVTPDLSEARPAEGAETSAGETNATSGLAAWIGPE